jgi:hypothetical protein
MKLCDTCSKLPNYQQLKVQDTRQLAFFYGDATYKGSQISIARKRPVICVYCSCGKHEEDIEPHVHLETYKGGCICACHWGLKP